MFLSPLLLQLLAACWHPPHHVADQVVLDPVHDVVFIVDPHTRARGPYGVAGTIWIADRSLEWCAPVADFIIDFAGDPESEIYFDDPSRSVRYAYFSRRPLEPDPSARLRVLGQKCPAFAGLERQKAILHPTKPRPPTRGGQTPL